MSASEPDQRKPVTIEIATVYAALNETEQKFNELQSSYRRLASIWLLATFSAIGYIWSNQLPTGIEANLVIGTIIALSGVGNFLLWLVDIGVYQKLLSATYVEGIKFEQEYKLPRIRKNMSKIFNGKNVSRRLSLFYVIPTSLMLPFGLFTVGREYFDASGHVLILMGLGAVVLSAIIFVLMRRASGTTKHTPK